MVEGDAHQQIGYLLRSYPRLSQTFILNEILALEEIGLKVQIFAMTNPQERIVQPQAARVRARVHYLDAAGQRGWISMLREHLRRLRAAPLRYFKAFGTVLSGREIDAGYHASSRFECFLQAVTLAGLLEDESRRSGASIRHLHAHFAHDPALVALLLHLLTGIPYSFTAHARDLYQVPRAALRRRAEQARAVVTCCRANQAYLQQVLPETSASRLHLIYHGADLQAFRPASSQPRDEPPFILSVGRLVEKKGFPDLLRALQGLQQEGLDFRCEIYGEGPLREDLSLLVQQLGLAERVVLAGACSQDQLVPVFQRADLFALTPSVTEDGDRDGIPNVLVEAMACGLPVVTTAAGGIAELVIHGTNGLLFEPRDVPAISAGLAALLRDEARRRRMSASARQTVAENFDLRMGASQMAALFV